jgi:hypothetical protein
MSVRQQKRSNTLNLLQLESRDVPATFYVDPTLAASANGSTQTFNAGKANQVAGLIFGTTQATANAVLFPTLTAAMAKADLSAGADTILLANGDIAVDNSAGAVQVNDTTTLIGSGKGVSILKPTTNTTGATILVNPGKFLTGSAFSYDATGKNIGTGIFIQSATATFTDIAVLNVQSGDNQGTALAADAGSYLGVVGSSITGYDRIGVSYYNSMGSVYTSTITGVGVVPTNVVNYGVQVAGASKANIYLNTFSGHQDTSAVAEQSAGVFLYQDGGAADAFILNNTFENNTYGVLVGFVRGTDASTATITRNNFATTNVIGVVAENNLTVNARRNYWGAKNGPQDLAQNPNGVGTRVDDQVDYIHWLKKPFQVGEVSSDFAIAPGNAGLSVYGITANNGLSKVTPGSFGGAWKGEVRVATGDVNGDGITDRVVGIGPGGGSKVEVYDGATGTLIRSFNAYVPTFTGGLYVASGDLTGDGKDDIITGAGFGGGPHVRAFDGVTGALIRDFLVNLPDVTTGITVASGDIDNDGFDDIITGSATTNSRVRVFSAFYNPTTGFGLLQDFFAYGDSNFGGGVFVAGGDVNGDGRADVITGAGPTGGAHVRIWNSNINGSKGAKTSDFIVPGLTAFTGGIRVTAKDLNDDGCEDLIIGTGPASPTSGAGSDTAIRIVFATNLGLAAPPVTIFAPWGAYGNSSAATNGLYVG